jgi:gas vesicle protein
MGKDPETIRREIEATREDMGETVDALGNKADVKGRAKGAVQDRKDAVMSKIGLAGDKVNETTPSGEDVRQGARRAAGVAQENPLGLAVGAVAAGFLAGMLIPSTRIEDERLGPKADEVKDRAREAGQQAIEHGKEAAQDVASSAAEQAQEVAQNTAEHAKEAARSTAQEAGDAAREQASEVSGGDGASQGNGLNEAAGAPTPGPPGSVA